MYHNVDPRHIQDNLYSYPCSSCQTIGVFKIFVKNVLFIVSTNAAMNIDHGETIFKIFSNRPYVVLK